MIDFNEWDNEIRRKKKKIEDEKKLKESANKAGSVSSSSKNKNDFFDNWDKEIQEKRAKIMPQNKVSSFLSNKGITTQSTKVKPQDVYVAKVTTNQINPAFPMFGTKTTAEQDEQLVSDVKGYIQKYKNSSYKDLKNQVAKNAQNTTATISQDKGLQINPQPANPNISANEKAFIQNRKNALLKSEGTAYDVKKEIDEAEKNNKPTGELKNLYYQKHKEEDQNRITGFLSTKDALKVNNPKLYSETIKPKTKTLSGKDALVYNTGQMNAMKIKNSIDILSDSASEEMKKDKVYQQINLYRHKKFMNGTNAYVDKNNADEYEKYNRMKDEEVDNYNYLYNQFGKEYADKYLYFLDLDNRQYKLDISHAEDSAEEHPISSTIVSFLANNIGGIEATIGSVKDFFNPEENEYGEDKLSEKKDYNRLTNMSNAMRSKVAENIEKDLGNGIWGKVGSFAYNVGNSMGDFALSLATAGGNGNLSLITMGSSAFANTTIEAKQNGMSDEQAFSLGVISGTAEALTEKFSVEALMKTPKKAIEYLATNILTEGSEEVASDIINDAADFVIGGDQSKWSRSLRDYKRQGCDDQTAVTNTLWDYGKQWLLDGLAGAVSGGIMATPGTVYASMNSKVNKNISEEEKTNIQNSATDEKLAGTALQKQAQKLQTKIDNSEQITDYELLKYQTSATKEMNNSILKSNANVEDNNTQTNGSNTFTVNTENGKKQVKSTLGQAHPNGIIVTVDSKPNVKAVTNIKSSGDGDMVLDTDSGTTVKLSDVEFKSPTNKLLFETASNFDTNGAKQFVANYETFKAENKNKTLDDYTESFKLLYDEATNGLSKDEINKYRDTSKAAKQLGNIAVNAVNAGINDRQALVKEYAQVSAVIDNHYAQLEQEQQAYDDNRSYENGDKVFQKYAENYEGDTEHFADMFNKVYTAGTRGVSYKSLANNINYADVIRELQQPVVEEILQAGQQDNEINVSKNSENYTRNTSNEENEFKNEGKLTVTDSAYKKIYNNKNISSDNAVDKIESVSALEQIANSIGTEIVVDDIDQKYNGYYQDGKIHINVNKTAEGMLFAVTHESVHYLKQINPQGYNELKNFVMDVLADSGINLDNRVQKVIDAYLDTNSLDLNNLTADAEEEIVANAFGAIISNEEAMQKAYKLPAKKKSTLLSAIKSIINKLKSFLNKISGNMPEVKAIKENISAQIKMAEIFADGLEKSNVQNEKISTIDELGETLPGTKFSVYEDGSQRNLIAVHNLSPSNLEKTLDRGGFPMPSIAVTKYDMLHENFGEVSVLFDKDTINPEIPNNAVYGGDVYSATYPQIDYKLNEQKTSNLYAYFGKLIGSKTMAFGINPVGFHPDNIKSAIQKSNGEINYINSLKNDYGMKNLFLSINDNQVKSIQNIETTQIVDISKEYADFYNYVYSQMGEEIDSIKDSPSARAWYHKYKDKLISVINNYKNNKFKYEINSGLKATSLAKKILNYKENNGRIINKTTEPDIKGAKKEIDKRINQDEFEKWLNDTFSGIVDKTGIRKPNVNAYYSNGDRKSFEQLHYADTLDNIVKAMKEIDNGDSFFSGNQLWAIGAKKYENIPDIKSDSSRLQFMNEEEHSKIISEFGIRFSKIAKKLEVESEYLDSAFNNISDAVRNSKNESEILRYLKRYYPKTATKEIISDIANLLTDVSNMPTGYFEAKPKRAVGLNEIKAVVLPKGTSQNLINKLNQNKIPFYVYDNNNKESRFDVTQKAISDSNIRFSIDEGSTSEIETAISLENTNRFAVNLLLNSSKDFKITNDTYYKAAQKVLGEYESTMSIKQYAESMRALLEFAQERGIDNPADLMQQMAQINNTALDKSAKVYDHFAEERKEIMAYLRNSTLLITDRQVQMLEFGMGTQRYRQLMYGTTNIKKAENHGKSITGDIDRQGGHTMYLTEAYNTLQEQYGYALFPEVLEDEMPEQLLRIKDLLKPQVETLYGENKYDVCMQMAQDYIAEVVKQRYDKNNKSMKKKIEKLQNMQLKWRENIRQEYEERLQKAHKRLKSQIDNQKQQIKDIRLDRDKKIEELRAKQRNTLANRQDARLKTIYKEKIRTLCNRLAKKISTDVRKEGIPLPRALMLNISSLADIIDPGTTKAGNAISGYTAFSKMKDLYNDLKNADNSANKGNSKGIYALKHQQMIEDYIALVAKQIGDTPLNKLNGYQTEYVYQLLRVIEDNLNEATKIIVDGKKMEIFEVGKQVFEDVSKAPGIQKKNKVDVDSIMKKGSNFATNYMLDSMRFFRKIVNYNDSPLMGIVREFDKADSKEAFIRMESNQVFYDVVNKYKEEMKTFDGKNAKMLDFGLYDRQTKRKVLISPAQAVGIYELSMNEDSKRRFVIDNDTNGNAIKIPGGLNIPYYKDYAKGNMKDADRKSSIVIMGESTLNEICTYVKKDGLCREFAKATEIYFNEIAPKYINETSEEMYGYPITMKSHYYPIVSDKNFVTTDFESIVRDASLKNAGWTKHRVVSSNPIILENVTNLLQRYINSVARYSAYVPVINNFEKIYNYSNIYTGEAPQSIKRIIEKKYGKIATEYIETFISDLQVPPKTSKKLSWLRGNFAQAVLSMNLSVTMKQAASYPTAAAILGYKPLMKALYKGENAEGETKHFFYRANRAEINETSGVYWERYQGDNTAEMRELIANSGWTKKVPYLMDWIKKVDVATTGRLYQACKYYMEEEYSNLEVGSKEYKEKLTEIFERVIKETQPQYTTVHRPMVLRSENEIVKTMSMFFTQRLQNFGLMYDAAGNLRAKSMQYKMDSSEKNKKALVEARKQFVRTYTSQAIAGATISLMTLAAKFLLHNLDRYKDDEDELTLYSILKTLGLDWLETMSGNVLFGNELYTLIGDTAKIISGEKIYSSDIFDLGAMNAVNELVSGFQNLLALTGSDNVTAEKFGVKFFKALEPISRLAGIPAKNVVNIGMGLYNSVVDSVNGNFFAFEAGSNIELTSADYGDILYDKLIDGDKEGYTKTYNKAMKAGIDGKKIQSAIKDRLVEDETLQQAAIALDKNDLEKYNAKFDILEKFGFKSNTIKKAITYYTEHFINPPEEKEETKSKSNYTQDELFGNDGEEENTSSRYDYDDLYKFYKSGDTEKYEEVKQYLLENGKNAQQLSSAIKSREKKEK